MQYDALLEMFGQKVKIPNFQFYQFFHFFTFSGRRIRRTQARSSRSQVDFADSKDANQRADSKAQRPKTSDVKVVQLVWY